MSHVVVPMPGMFTRGLPRWSVEGQPLSTPESIAGLPDWRAWVGVKPPLFLSPAIFGLTLIRSEGPRPQLEPFSRFPPREVTAAKQFVPLLARTTFLSSLTPSGSGSSGSRLDIQEPRTAELFAIVTLVRVA